VEDPEEAMDMHEGGGIMIKMAEPDNKTFTDLKAGLQIEQKEFMSRIFLIETALPQGDWKLTGEQKMILEYPCQQAVSKEEDREVIVWFTPAIAVPAGPGKFGNLPGLVLEVNMGQGDHLLVAKSVELKELDKALLKKPNKGKHVTEEEYDAIVEEKLKEMGVEGEGGSGHTVVVKIRQ
jgi:GLPGLI family protein